MHSSSLWVQELQPKGHGWLYIMAIRGLSSSDKDKPLHYGGWRICVGGGGQFDGPIRSACVVREGFLQLIRLVSHRHTQVNSKPPCVSGCGGTSAPLVQSSANQERASLENRWITKIEICRCGKLLRVIQYLRPLLWCNSFELLRLCSWRSDLCYWTFKTVLLLQCELYHT